MRSTLGFIFLAFPRPDDFALRIAGDIGKNESRLRSPRLLRAVDDLSVRLDIDSYALDPVINPRFSKVD